MTGTTSATGGYLVPVGFQQDEDADLDLLLQPVIVGITQLDQKLVRRRWQEDLAGRPKDRSVNWCSFGALSTESDVNPTFVHDGDAACGQGQSASYRTETVDVLVSFFGPQCRSYGALLRDGFGVGQNREALQKLGIAFVRTERLTLVPELIGDAYIRRCDLVFRIRRTMVRVLNIQNVVGITGQVETDRGVTSSL